MSDGLNDIQRVFKDAVVFLLTRGRDALKCYGYIFFSFLDREQFISYLSMHYSRSRAYAIVSEIEREIKRLLKDESFKNAYENIKNKLREV